jgi:branched-chain amino acid transport system ATP-binding protein
MLLEVRNLSKTFGGLKAVNDASIELPQGRIVALIGPNGAGKTTLFASIAGFIRPDTGIVRFDGTDITGWEPHRICESGMVRTFQITQPFMRLSVLENIMVGTYARTSNRHEAADRAEAVASLVGMKRLLSVESSRLTVASRKRLELARALGTSPRVLLLDEVMAGLNPTEVVEIVEIIESIRDSGVSILLIEHVMQAVMSLAEDIYVLSQGSIIAHGDAHEVTSNAAVIEAYFGASLKRSA